MGARMRKNFSQADTKGFTLVEIMVALGVVLILIVVSQAALFGVQKQRRASVAKNNFVAMVREARSSALLLGSASGTPRVATPTGQPGQCPAAFRDDLTGGFRAGFEVNMNDIPGGWTPTLASNAQGHSVTYVSQIVRNVPVSAGGVPALPTYQVLCKTVNLPQAHRNAVIFNRSLAEGLNSDNRLILTFDSRGFIDSAGAGALDDGVISVPLRENEEGSSLARSFRDENVLVFASGFSCIESGPGTGTCRDGDEQ